MIEIEQRPGLCFMNDYKFNIELITKPCQNSGLRVMEAGRVAREVQGKNNSEEQLENWCINLT